MLIPDKDIIRERKKDKVDCRAISQMNIGSKIQTKYIKLNS